MNLEDKIGSEMDKICKKCGEYTQGKSDLIKVEYREY